MVEIIEDILTIELIGKCHYLLKLNENVGMSISYGF